MFENDEPEVEAAHHKLVSRSVLEPVVAGGADERAWLDCDLASLAENRLGEMSDPRQLDPATRESWRVRATRERECILERREQLEHCYWIVEGGARAGTIALGRFAPGGKHLRVSSLYVLPQY